MDGWMQPSNLENIEEAVPRSRQRLPEETSRTSMQPLYSSDLSFESSSTSHVKFAPKSMVVVNSAFEPIAQPTGLPTRQADSDDNPEQVDTPGKSKSNLEIDATATVETETALDRSPTSCSIDSKPAISSGGTRRMSEFKGGRTSTISQTAFEAESKDWKEFMRDAVSKKKSGGAAADKSQCIKQIARHVEMSLQTPPGKLRQMLMHLVQGTLFQGLCATVITANAIIMGIEININITNALASPTHRATAPEWSQPLNRAFTFFFAAELLLRMVALRLHFLFGTDWRWNGFDSFIVALSLPEEIGDFLSNISFFTDPARCQDCARCPRYQSRAILSRYALDGLQHHAVAILDILGDDVARHHHVPVCHLLHAGELRTHAG
jgi:hypothetical protein